MMTDHETYKQIKKERKKPYRKQYGEKGSWEKARKSRKKDGKILRVMEDQCVCSHNKYHHEFEESKTTSAINEYGTCLHYSDCGCDHYQEFIDDKPNTEEQEEWLKNNSIEDLPFT